MKSAHEVPVAVSGKQWRGTGSRKLAKVDWQETKASLLVISLRCGPKAGRGRWHRGRSRKNRRELIDRGATGLVLVAPADYRPALHRLYIHLETKTPCTNKSDA